MKPPFFFAIGLLLAGALQAEAKDYVAYYVVDRPATSGTIKQYKIGADGKPEIDPVSRLPRIVEVTVQTEPRRVYVLVKKSFIGVDRLWRDAVYEVPSSFHTMWEGKGKGDEVKLPLGWPNWRKVKGEERKSVVKDVDAWRGNYHASPKEKGWVIRIQNGK